jgi:excisionase family DNA binding protein
MTTTILQNVTDATKEREAFSIAELAARYGLSPGLVRLEIARGRLRSVRIGRRVLILKRDIEEWVSRV